MHERNRAFATPSADYFKPCPTVAYYAVQYWLASTFKPVQTGPTMFTLMYCCFIRSHAPFPLGQVKVLDWSLFQSSGGLARSALWLSRPTEV